MLKDIEWSEDRDYKTKTDNEPIQFYLDALNNSTEFNLLLGYFSSAAINLLSIGFASFISRGGNVKIVINHLLSEKDQNLFAKGLDISIEKKYFDLTDIASLHKILDEYDTHFFECLAYLISEKRITLKVIKPKNGNGIAHYKSGVFYDGQNYVGYKASCNFTLYGLSENLEHLEAFLSWEDGRSSKLIKKELNNITNYFNESDESVDYLSVENIEIAIKEHFGSKDINELIVREEQLLKQKISMNANEKIRNITTKLLHDTNNDIRKPRFPYNDGPRLYQKIAFENWKNNNQQGLFAMATGTGKTITALNCLLEVYKKTGYYKALILVPTITLINQWEKECKLFNFNSIIKVYSKNNWINDFSAILTKEKLLPTNQISFIVISTYASYARESIFSDLNKLPSKTLLIADECHNMGSASILKNIERVNLKRRIGLSATPERQFDNKGNNILYSFFNSENKFTYVYSMQEAINNKVLCRYYYYPHLVSLTDKEMKNYSELSVKIFQFYKNDSDSFKSDPILTRLLLARKRIIHKAYNKLSIFKKIINEEYKNKGHLKFTLVYVPEGNGPNDFYECDFFSIQDEIEIDNDETLLIDSFSQVVKEVDNRITINQFKSSTSEKENILNQFANGEIDVLASMKCLDEGVDVPRAELAIFCASTGNPRQFVQRRGRILRTHRDKQYAYIHDLVVIPKVKTNNKTFKMERSLLKKELERVNNFSLLSENSSDTINILSDIMNYYNLNLYKND